MASTKPSPMGKPTLPPPGPTRQTSTPAAGVAPGTQGTGAPNEQPQVVNLLHILIFLFYTIVCLGDEYQFYYRCKSTLCSTEYSMRSTFLTSKIFMCNKSSSNRGGYFVQYDC